MAQAFRDRPCAGEGVNGMAEVIDQACWGCSAAGNLGLVQHLVGSHGSCCCSYRCVRTVRTRDAGVGLGEVSWAGEADWGCAPIYKLATEFAFESSTIELAWP